MTNIEGSTTTLPLAGVKVIDLSRLLPGPWCAQTLGDMGADVIKVEQPNIGDYSRFNPPFYQQSSVYFNSVNRNKRSVVLDFTKDKDRECASRLLSSADIVVESFRPGVTEKYGLDYKSMVKNNKGLIYCSITGFGCDGPLAKVPGHDLSLQGMTGQLGVVKASQQDTPPMPAFQTADYAGATYAVMAILAAYIQRMNSGVGRHLDISLFDSAISLSNIVLSGAMSRIAGHSGKPELEVWGGNPRYSTYRTKDAKAVTVVLLESRTWHRFCQLIGREDLIVEEGHGDRHSAHGKNAEAFREAIATFCLSYGRDELTDLMMKQDIPICPIYSPDEAIGSHEAVVRGLVQMVSHPDEGPIPVVVDPLSRAGLSDPTRAVAPRLGQHNSEVLSEINCRIPG